MPTLRTCAYQTNHYTCPVQVDPTESIFCTAHDKVLTAPVPLAAAEDDGRCQYEVRAWRCGFADNGTGYCDVHGTATHSTAVVADKKIVEPTDFLIAVQPMFPAEHYAAKLTDLVQRSRWLEREKQQEAERTKDMESILLAAERWAEETKRRHWHCRNCAEEIGCPQGDAARKLADDIRTYRHKHIRP